MKRRIVLVSAAIVAVAAHAVDVPITPAQEAYLARGVMAIVHWGPNTYAGQEQGFGNVRPEIVKPLDFKPAQWAKAMRAGGIRAVVFVAKHNDGFCLWPSEHNRDYSTAALEGKLKSIDIVKAVEKACRREGMAFGVGILPWDRRQGSYGNPEYVTYYHNQWKEMFSGKYGQLCEIWLAGADDGVGWYGGVNGDKGERRKVPADYCQKQELLEIFLRHNPMGVAFGMRRENSVIGCGTARGVLSDNWRYACKGDDGKTHFMSPEVDMPLREGWYFHDNEQPKSLKRMIDCYFESVGRGGVLCWGVAPNREGRICDADVARLKAFGEYVRTFNAVNLAKGASVQTTVDDRSDAVTYHLAAPVSCNALDFGEDLSKGQLANRWTVSAWIGNAWKEVAKGRTVGYRRIARFDEVKSNIYRIQITGSNARPKIVRPAIRYAAPVKDTGTVRYGETVQSGCGKK